VSSSEKYGPRRALREPVVDRSASAGSLADGIGWRPERRLGWRERPKITFSAFEGTPLDIALRDCGINAFAICGVATEIGIEPTVRHGADLGYIPIVVTDACGAGHEEAGQRALANIEFMGDAFLTDVATFQGILARHADS
jgi:Isochorismatase family